MTRRSVQGLFSFLVLVAAVAGCAPAPGVSGAPGSTAYVQHLAADQVDTWRGVHYDGLILDVRSTAEWEDDLNHLDNAVQAPVETLESRLQEFDRYRNGTVLVYDRTGANSTRAAQILVTHEFRDVSVIDGGLKAYRDWQKAAHP
jgi:rhodanese-related sulfurtransferase